MATVSPTPINSPSLPLPDPADRATFGDRMREQLRWQREDAQPGFELLASQTYQNAQAAEDASVAAIGSANFKGEWSALSGALNVPSAVWHNSRVWALLVNLADVTASEPGVSANWVDVGGVKRSGDIMTGPLSVPDLTATDRLKIPTWTTAGRPSVPAVGDTGFNSTLGTNETWNGSNWVPDGFIALVSNVALSGSAYDLTGIEPWVNHLRLVYGGLSASVDGVSNVQLGTSTGVVATGYDNTAWGSGGANSIGTARVTTSFTISNGQASTYLMGGVLDIIRRSGNTWTCRGTGQVEGSATAFGNNGVMGDLGGALTRIRFNPGAGNFDGGVLSVFASR